jgi:DNA-binding transcriptional LysR family regulator
MPNEYRHHLRLLGALDALLSERNVTRAAERLNLSQPATSGALAQLRHLFNDPLLVRAGRELELTPRAQELLPRVQDALASVDALFGSQVSFVPALLRRQFRVAASDAVGQLLMPAVVERLAVLAPQATLKISSAGFDVPEKLLASGALDIVVAHHADIPPSLRAATLYENRLVVVARAGPRPATATMDLDRFTASAHVTVFPHSASVEEELRRVFGAAGRPFRLAASAQLLSVAMAIVARTDALALVTEPIARLYAPMHHLRSFDPPTELRLPTVPVRAIWHERAQHDPACAWLRQVMRDCAGQRS